MGDRVTSRDPIDRAREAVCVLLAAYEEARDTNEREQVARLIGLLAPHGGRSLTELAAEARGTPPDPLPPRTP